MSYATTPQTGMSHAAAAAELAPSGTLRAGINLQNQLLVSGRDDDGDPVGVAPGMARAVADRLGVPLRLVPFDTAKKLSEAIEREEWDVGFLAADPTRATHIGFTAA